MELRSGERAVVDRVAKQLYIRGTWRDAAPSRTHGLRGVYYRQNFEAVADQVDATIDFDWGDGEPVAGAGSLMAPALPQPAAPPPPPSGKPVRTAKAPKEGC